MSNISDEPVFDGVYRAFLSRLYFHRHTIYSAIGTLAITGITLYVEQIRNRGVIPPDDKIWTIGLGLAGFIAVELAILLSFIESLSGLLMTKRHKSTA